jgi:hypothetical protein
LKPQESTPIFFAKNGTMHPSQQSFFKTPAKFCTKGAPKLYNRGVVKMMATKFKSIISSVMMDSNMFLVAVFSRNQIPVIQ